MRVLTGSLPDPAADRAATEGLVTWTRRHDEAALRVWRPPGQVAFGPRDARADGYDRARAVAQSRGYAPLERGTGGRAAAFTGRTVAVVFAEPTDDQRRGIEDRYERAVARVAGALSTLGVETERGEPPDSFCPGTHSLRAGGKLAGLAQRVRREVAVVAGVVITDDHREVSAVLGPVYDALGLSFDPESVGSVARAGGEGDPERVARAIRAAFVGDRPTTVRAVEDRPP